MARKLKTFITNLGFFELAIAAPSMKAALEAWGMSHNAFQQGFAKQTEDPAIVAATIAKPGIVLRRAVGTSGEFTENAELPKVLPNIRPSAVTEAKRQPKLSRRLASKKSAERDRASVISFEKAKRKREEQEAREETKRAEEGDARRRAIEKAELALEDAREAHEKILKEIEDERAKLDRRAEKEENRWKAQQERLEVAIDGAHK